MASLGIMRGRSPTLGPGCYGWFGWKKIHLMLRHLLGENRNLGEDNKVPPWVKPRDYKEKHFEVSPEIEVH